MTNQIVMYSLLTVMHFTTPEECQMWSEKVYGEEFRCFKSFREKEWYAKPPLNKPKDIDTLDVKE